MKIIYSLFFLVMAYTNSTAQLVTADPATGQMDITDQAGISLNANFIAPGSVVILKVPVYNLNQLVGLPVGSCKLTINLGNNMIVDPAFNLATAPLSNYFSWTAAQVGGNVEITGNLVAPLPADFNGIAEFNIKASTVLGTSFVSTDFIVTNNTALRDEDPNNNTATLTYTVTLQTLPVTFTKVWLTKNECLVTVDFTIENEINIRRYEIEISKDGRHYKKLGETVAKNRKAYSYDFQLGDSIVSNSLFVRIKSLGSDGSNSYSETKMVSGVCASKKSQINVYPNPFTSQHSNLAISKEGYSLFNGQYKISLIDMVGKVLENKLLKVANTRQIIYSPAISTAGVYYLQLQNTNDMSTSVLKIVKF